MRIIAIHVDYARYRVKKKTPMAEPIDKHEDSIEDGVLLMCCVEKADEDDPGSVIENASAGVLKRLNMLKVKKVMIYPYAHLSNDLSSPEAAVGVLKGLEKSLRDLEIDVKRAAFGWYKELESRSKGHPLSDLSMSICACQEGNCPLSPCQSPIENKASFFPPQES
ncbi:TPA: hypothetical protein HA351_13850 [Methanosarcinaceae archaeon]|nr:hypothetical protein [Methanosarcinaceae archaeon]